MSALLSTKCMPEVVQARTPCSLKQGKPRSLMMCSAAATDRVQMKADVRSSFPCLRPFDPRWILDIAPESVYTTYHDIMKRYFCCGAKEVRDGIPDRLQGDPSAAQINTYHKLTQLLQAAERVKRGLTATDEDKASIDDMAKSLEAVNPNPESLSAKEINGRWKLVYTTSEGILGTKRLPFLRPIGPIYQIIDAENLKARNNETWPLFNSVTANLTPVNKSLVNVQFQQFKIGNIVPITAPPTAKGSLDTTYVDEDLRISRGDKGNLFVLTMDDPTVRLAEQ